MNTYLKEGGGGGSSTHSLTRWSDDVGDSHWDGRITAKTTIQVESGTADNTINVTKERSSDVFDSNEAKGREVTIEGAAAPTSAISSGN